MVSFFRKKKKSAQAAKKDETSQATTTSTNEPASTGGATTTTGAPSTPPTLAPDQKQKTGKRTASYPSKRRTNKNNNLAGSLKGSRSSVSRLPAVEEEHGVAGTPDTAISATPDLLGTLSFDNQEEGQVEILTQEAKDEVKKQLKFDTPTRGSRIASMEISAQGIVTQISQDEDTDILLESVLKEEAEEREEELEEGQTNIATTPSTTLDADIETPQRSGGRSMDEAALSPESDQKTEATSASTKPDPPETESQTDAVFRGGHDVLAGDIPSVESYEDYAQEHAPAQTISVDGNDSRLVSPLGMQPSKEEPQHTDGADDEQGNVEERTAEETSGQPSLAENTNEESKVDWTKSNEDNTLQMMEKRIKDVATSVMNTLHCIPKQVQKAAPETPKPIRTNTMEMFYDDMCQPVDLEENPRRPFFDEEFAQRFVKRMLSSGISLLYLQPPGTTSNPSEDWKGRTVVMKIVPGSTGDQEAIQPRLQWTTMAGGTVPKSFMTSLSLLRIHSVLTASKSLVPEESTSADLDDDDLCFVSITSVSGKVFLFEANSVTERDEIANGLRNIVARLSFHLVAGDHLASTELYNDERAIREETEPGDLPALANPKLNMNRMTHLLLEV